MRRRRSRADRQHLPPAMVTALMATLIWMAATQGRAQSIEPRGAQQACVVPFQLVSNFLILVTGSIGDLGNLNFVVDTGTARTLVDQGLRSSLAEPERRTFIQGFGTRVETDAVRLPPLAVGSVVAHNLLALGWDLATLTDRFGIEVDAVVGLDVLEDHCFTIDYTTTVVTFGCTEPEPTLTSLDSRSPYPVVDVRVNGIPYRLLVDSGSEVIALFSRAMPPEARGQPGIEVGAAHIAASTHLRQLAVRSVTIGGHPVGSPPVFVMDDVYAMTGYDGVLGTRWFPSSRVQIDLPQRKLSW